MDIQDELRDVCNGLRTKSIPLSSLIPLLQRAADHIDTLDMLIFELDEHEGAEGWSQELQARLNLWKKS